MNHQNTKISENGIFERCVFSRSFAPLNRNIFFWSPKSMKMAFLDPKMAKKGSKMVKMRNFWKKRPLTKNYTLLFNTYFYKIKISIFKKLKFGPKGPKMKKQKLHNFANIREHFFQKVQKWPKWPKMTFLTKSDIFWIENNIFFITFM